jgi:hypothetical protein
MCREAGGQANEVTWMGGCRLAADLCFPPSAQCQVKSGSCAVNSHCRASVCV